MAAAPTQIRIDSDVKREASALFSRLRPDMSGAVDLFLRQCVLRGGLPFPVELSAYSKQTPDAMAEAKKIGNSRPSRTNTPKPEKKTVRKKEAEPVDEKEDSGTDKEREELLKLLKG